MPTTRIDPGTSLEHKNAPHSYTSFRNREFAFFLRDFDIWTWHQVTCTQLAQVWDRVEKTVADGSSWVHGEMLAKIEKAPCKYEKLLVSVGKPVVESEVCGGQ